VAISEEKPPPIRSDLEIVPQYYRGELSYVAKDPVTLSYYRLREVEYVVVKCFQRGMGVEQTQQEVKKKTGAELSALEIYKFAEQLRSSNLLKSRGMEDVRRLARNKRLARKHKFKQVISNYLFITIPLWDPDRTLNKLLPYFRLLLNPFFLACWLLAAAGALWIIMGNFSVLVSDAFSLLSVENLLILSGVVFSVKVIHEMGHALTCKHFGGEVHAIGPAFLVFQPIMFTDATDAWLFPSKWARVMVGGAGIVAEIWLASIAAFVWISSEPGIAKQIAYSTMVTCSVGTVLFNANPLLRFDGYYILSDLLEIPNLRIKTSQYLGYLFDRYMLGIQKQPPAMQSKDRNIYVIYGVARFFYRMFIVLMIGFFLYSLFVPLGVFAWASSAYGMVLMPMWKRGKELARQFKTGTVRIRYLAIVTSVLAALVGLWFVPIEYTIQAPCVVAPPSISVVRTAVRGRVERILVEPGQKVTQGQPLVEMKRPELLYRAEQLKAFIKQLDVRIRRALAANASGYEIQLREKRKLTDELARVEEQIERLVLRAPHDGVVVDLHRVEMRASAPQHGFAGFPDEDYAAELTRFEGTTLAAGTGILGVADSSGFLFETFVYEHDVANLSLSDPMTCLLPSQPEKEFESRVHSMVPVDVKAIENVGITLADVGYIPVKPTADGRQEPLVAIYRVRSNLMENKQHLRWGLTGKALITYGSGPMGSYYFDRMVRALRLRLQRI